MLHVLGRGSAGECRKSFVTAAFVRPQASGFANGETLGSFSLLVKGIEFEADW